MIVDNNKKWVGMDPSKVSKKSMEEFLEAEKQAREAVRKKMEAKRAIKKPLSKKVVQEERMTTNNIKSNTIVRDFSKDKKRALSLLKAEKQAREAVRKKIEVKNINLNQKKKIENETELQKRLKTISNRFR